MVGRLAGAVTLTYRSIAGHPLCTHPAQLLVRICDDLKRIWSCPRSVSHGSGLTSALGVLGVTAALIALDPYDTPFLQQGRYQELPAIRVLNRILSGRNMALLINAV